MKRHTLGAVFCALTLSLAGCGTPSPSLPDDPCPTPQTPIFSVEKIPSLKSNLIFGIDTSSLISLEQSGVTFYDFDGNQADALQTLAQAGVNCIRLRVWNDPFDENGNGYGGGNCTIDTAIALGKRATAYGMTTMINFHYSDFWADPGKQTAPKAWQTFSLAEKYQAVYDYTSTCLQRLSDEGVSVSFVQVGNETNNGLCGESDWPSICALMNAGSSAVRALLPQAKVVLHFTNPEKDGLFPYICQQLSANAVDYDVFATSYYPVWHGTLTNLSTVLTNVANTYHKQVMVAETSYPFTNEDTDFYGNTISDGGSFTKDYPFSVQGQADCLRNVIATVNAIPNSIGVCYWEGAWISVGGKSYEENLSLWQRYGSGWANACASAYEADCALYYGGSAVDNQALFDAKGNPLDSLKVFQLIR